jgi:lipopolysaccharide transport system ATP-binding protein
MTKAVIQIDHLSKRYRLGGQQGSYQTLRESLVSAVTLKRSNQPNSSEIWALKDVSLLIQQGDVLGIIGRNGAGKSTLLKIISRITRPTSGQVRLRGRVGSLLEVGTGFHPELTGRENIYLYGAILGMHKAEIAQKFDEIIAFAEIEQFLDTPVKRYSSGMYMRLAFAVAAHLEPEILLVDEVLAVGDAAFQKKCLGKMGDVSRQGRTVLFVSHNMGAVSQLCHRCILLERGRLSVDGLPAEVISRYVSSASQVADGSEWERTGSGKVRVRTVTLLDAKQNPTQTFFMGQKMFIRLSGKTDVSQIEFSLTIQIGTLSGILVLYAQDQYKLFRATRQKSFEIEVNIPELSLMPGPYAVHVWIGQMGIETFDQVWGAASFDVVQSEIAATTHPINQKYGLVYHPLLAEQVG